MATDLEKVLQMAGKAEFGRVPPQYNGRGEAVEPDCNDCMQIYLLVNHRRMVVEAGYQITEGACSTVSACACAAVMMAKDQPVMKAYTVTAAQIGHILSDDGGLNQEHIHCAMMAELSLKRAVLDYVAQAGI